MGNFERDFVKDFAKRTRKNLDAIDALRALGLGVFEVTQLVNSCLGLLVFPHEKYHKIPQKRLSELESIGWPIPHIEKGEQVIYLKDLIESLRHAIAHGNLDFIPGKSEIQGIRLSNIWRGETTSWIIPNIKDLREFVIKFSDMLIHE